MRLIAAVLWLSSVYIVVDAKVKLFNSDSGLTPPVKKTPKVWLYTSVAADYDGARWLPHFIKHYTDLGIAKENFLLVLNHNPNATNLADGATPLEDCIAVLDKAGIKYHLWLDQYSSEKLYKIRLTLLNKADKNDWIVHADSDEFHDYGVRSVIKYLEKAEKEGLNEVKGVYVDRVSATGELNKVEASPSIFQQFPNKCQVIKTFTTGRDVKAMAYKGFWRTDRGNHQVLRPVKAYEVLKGAPYPGGQSRGVVDAEDLYHLSPYYRYAKDYAFVCTSVEQHPNGTMKVALAPGQTCGGNANVNGLSRKSKGQEKVHHFKWHEGVINSIQDRLKYYKGDSEDKPRYGWFKDSQDLFEGIVQKGRLDVEKLGCTT